MKTLLEIRNLHASVAGKEILNLRPFHRGQLQVLHDTQVSTGQVRAAANG